MNAPAVAEVSARLVEASRLAVFDPSRRLDVKVDMSPEAISRRLRRVSALRDLCLRLGSLPQAAKRHESEG